MTATRFRLMYRFWLDVNKADEYELAETIDLLKQKRSFVETIRDGIRLITDLRAGQLDVLFELFPWVTETLRSEDKETHRGTDDLKRELVALREAVMAREGGGYGTPPPKRLAATDDAPELVLQKKSGTDAAANFLASLAALGQ